MIDSSQIIRWAELDNAAFYFSGSDQRIYINKQAYDNVAYISFTPQQNITPVYDVFHVSPRLMMRGNYIIKGTIGFNAVVANLEEFLISYYEASKYDYGILYFETLEIEIEGAILDGQRVTAILKAYEDQSGVEVKEKSIPLVHKRRWILSKVYLTGGATAFPPEAVPAQQVYSFLALNLEAHDEVYDLNKELITTNKDMAELLQEFPQTVTRKTEKKPEEPEKTQKEGESA